MKVETISAHSEDSEVLLEVHDGEERGREIYRYTT